MSDAVQRYLDALGRLFVARREAGGMLAQEDEARLMAILERYWEDLDASEREQMDAMFPDWRHP